MPKHLLTAEEFARMRLPDVRSELIEGRLVTTPLASMIHGEVTAHLCGLLGEHIHAHALGEAYIVTGFVTARNPDSVRASDIAFIHGERLPSRRRESFWVTVIPDLAVEVASWGDDAGELRRKAEMWLEAGVRLAWVVLPAERVIEVHRAGQPVATLDASATLDGAEIVPGFSTPVAAIFG